MNRFTNEKECIRNCSSQAEALYPQDERKACFLPLNKGSDVCRQQTVRFRYDPIHDKCKFFLWKGCIGNGNRFLTKQLCNDTCDGVHGLILGVVVGAIVLILIIVAVVMMVKSKNDPKKAPKKPKREEAPLQHSAIEMN
ncbi:hypothetical protein CRUP_018629 [Coryphaenoides rupestris]|nr:hypothetical protein CRUP_018629 [Coryphaenoides rupestris]